ncbi:MAG: hypothetical protein JO309_10370 [Pseudonocardiales bacterium]|nr:hypothetical protein [Pseudonocardiales bacterium]MBV9729785.1 hypothetical protein [Pseudonocardiales bacterium]
MADYTLPDLPYDYGALEPHISGEIMELHHSKHHATYVKGANTALEQLAQAREREALSAVNMLEKNLAFNLGGPARRPPALSRPGGWRTTTLIPFGAVREQPEGTLGGVAHLDPGCGESIAQGVGERPRTLFPSVFPHFEEGVDERRDDVPGIPRTNHGEFGQSCHHPTQHGPGPLGAVHFLGVGRPVNDRLLQFEDGRDCRIHVTGP